MTKDIFSEIPHGWQIGFLQSEADGRYYCRLEPGYNPRENEKSRSAFGPTPAEAIRNAVAKIDSTALSNEGETQ